MPMYFVQHGRAVPKEVDPDRPLSDEGCMDVERVGACLRRMGLTFRAIYHSGKTRARQTAEILSSEVGLDCIFKLEGMGPNDDVAKLAESLVDGAMYVGHLPQMEKLVSYLVAGNEHTVVVTFSNGGVACVGRDEGGYHVEWFLIPSLCPS